MRCIINVDTMEVLRHQTQQKQTSLKLSPKVWGSHCNLHYYCSQFSSVQSLSCVRFFATPWTAAHQVSLSITNSRSLLKLRCIELVMPSNRLILCRPLLMPSVFPSIRVFSSESVLRIRWPKYWSFIEPFSFSFFSINGWGIGLDFCDTEWFALETNRDHSVIFETASKYCISDSCWLWGLLHFF